MNYPLHIESSAFRNPHRNSVGSIATQNHSLEIRAKIIPSLDSNVVKASKTKHTEFKYSTNLINQILERNIYQELGPGN